MIQWIVTVTLMLVMLYGRTKIIPSLFVAPVTGSVIMALLVLCRKPMLIEQVFTLFGKHSTNIWLTHMFFYLAPFQRFVYRAKYPFCIFSFMMVITTVLSVLLQYIQKTIRKAIMRSE